MSTSQQVAYIWGFDRQWYDIGDVRDIGEKMGYGGVGSQTLPLAGARLGSQILPVAKEQMWFQALFNAPMGVDAAGNCGSCGSQVEF